MSSMNASSLTLVSIRKVRPIPLPRMPFGKSTAPQEFQSRQHEVLEGLSGVEVIADDILVYGSGDIIDLLVSLREIESAT